jgi:hypothetical protein
MGGDNVELLWYGLCLIKALITLVVVLLCKRFLHSITQNRVMRRSAKHKMVHLVSTLPPSRNFDASESKAVDASPNERKERIG